jgi:hypothetical protein
MAARLTGRMVHRTTCSGCSADLRVDRVAGTVSTLGRAPVTAPLENDDDDLVTWTCPLPGCAYADSLDLHA